MLRREERNRKINAPVAGVLCQCDAAVKAGFHIVVSAFRRGLLYFRKKQQTMTLTKFIYGVLVGLVLTNVSAAASVSDEEIRLALIGSWVNPPGQSKQLSIPARQIFRDNGTTTLYIYPTLECRDPAAYFEGNWAVVGGMLITLITGTTHPALVPIGTIEQLAVLAVEPNRIVFEADDEVYVRYKSETCYAADARRT